MQPSLRKPEWLKIQLQSNSNTVTIRKELAEKGLNTVCEEARCPNIHECWSQHRTATFMILGDRCTRRCGFCAVQTGHPVKPEEDEPQKIAKSIRRLGISHAVITMVTRDDLDDGGAHHMAETGKSIMALNTNTTVEYLVSDMQGKEKSIAVLVDSNPNILGHNLETVKRLTAKVRSRSSYERSLNFLRVAHRLSSKLILKSSIMLGLGEKLDEVLETLQDIRQTGCSLINIGQYLQPTKKNLSVQHYWHPEEFANLAEEARKIGYAHVESGPLVRSSYHAGDVWKIIKKTEG